jgi:ABC-type dipeptide/oligopeptide/nickel transport system permease subunit
MFHLVSMRQIALEKEAHGLDSISGNLGYFKCCTWLTTDSGLAIMLAVLACNLMGDAWRDLLDSRLRGE